MADGLSQCDPDPLVRIAALHALDYIERITVCLSVLGSEIRQHPRPLPGRVERWASQADWLYGLLKGEADSLRTALRGAAEGAA